MVSLRKKKFNERATLKRGLTLKNTSGDSRKNIQKIFIEEFIKRIKKEQDLNEEIDGNPELEDEPENNIEDLWRYKKIILEDLN
mmetsp:Transcript_6594/g.5688  ORF Transcript_6594/g.5688 Transcript_6594/m.5688 type:complete len:84 (+) Transcript_6594:92-343(+)